MIKLVRFQTRIHCRINGRSRKLLYLRELTGYNLGQWAEDGYVAMHKLPMSLHVGAKFNTGGNEYEIVGVM